MVFASGFDPLSSRFGVHSVGTSCLLTRHGSFTGFLDFLKATSSDDPLKQVLQLSGLRSQASCSTSSSSDI
jgi:hypothetical protein